jgi:tetratricopeptide (TPR) repeat protein
MELVRGIPITDFCDHNQLTPRERLELFVSVCQAVQHAHQKGIIHSDVKPSNVLVTLHDGVPVVKVIDFGIAKALGQQLTDKTMYTGFAQLVGTPLYMSPEQAELSGLDIDTRSDVYSLDVLLYELLTGTTPFDKARLHQAGLDEIRRIIREEEPPKPSTRISTLGQAATTISTQRKSDPKKLSQIVRGELDWIVMKCLEKDRNRRYETASALAADVQHYLHDEPVQACPPSPLYRFRKFARRHRMSFAIGALGAAVLVLAISGLAAGLIVVDRERRQTQGALEAEARQRGLAEQRLKLVIEVLDEICFKEVDKRMDFGGELGQASSFFKDPVKDRLERQFLEKGLHLYERLIEIDPADRAGQLELAKVYVRAALLRNLLGLRSEAKDAYEKGIRLAEKLAEEYPGDLQIMLELADTYLQGSGPLPLPGEVMDPETTRRKVLPLRKALALFERVAAETGNPDARQGMGDCHNNLGVVFARTMNQPGEAESEYTQALAIYEELEADFPNYAGGGNRADLGWTHELMAELFMGRERWDGAEKACRASLAVFERLAADFPGRDGVGVRARRHAAENHAYLADIYQASGRLRESESARRQAVADRNALVNQFPELGRYRWELTYNCAKLGGLLKDLGRLDEALVFLGKSIEANPDAGLYSGRGQLYAGLEQWDKAAADFAQAIKLKPDEAVTHYWHALARLAASDQAAYRKGCAELVKRCTRTEKEDDLRWTAWTCALAPDAVDDWKTPLRLAEHASRTDPKNATFSTTLGAVLYRAGRIDEALGELEKPIKLFEGSGANAVQSSPAYPWFFLALSHQRRGNAEEARRCLEKATELADRELKNQVPWNLKLTLELLRREVTAAIVPAEKK